MEPSPGADPQIDPQSTCNNDTIQITPTSSYRSDSSGNQSSGMLHGMPNIQNMPDKTPYSLSLFSMRLTELRRGLRKRKRDGERPLCEKAYINNCNVRDYAINVFMDMVPSSRLSKLPLLEPTYIGDPLTWSRRAALLCHVHLYVMGGSYGIHDLSWLALRYLKTTLQVYDVCAERLSDLVDLIRPLYEGTTRPDPGRDILSAYFAIILNDIVENQAFKEARRNYPEFDDDFSTAMKRQMPSPHVRQPVSTSRLPKLSSEGFNLDAALRTS
ncbi:hypothetical protein FDECE_14345 [Fusarium decemcellulare]|nr:hypothetical protein FDECE_14345 [Fusarium decemcellulare]